MKPISSWWAIAFNVITGVAATAAPVIIERYPWSVPIWAGVNAALQAITNQGPATKR